ncbi:MAG: hypothetical protein FWB99_00530 [Treponema sp.]|nr:hypothetical protein [Treponema sp.]
MKKNEKLLYQANAGPAALIIISLLFNTWQTIFTLNMVDVIAVGIRVMQIILLNTMLSFLVFITSFEVKRYSVKWSRVGVWIGVFQLLRVFVIPAGEPLTRTNIGVSLAASGVLLILASLWSLVKCGKYQRAMKEP